jgi:hypothetical protein
LFEYLEKSQLRAEQQAAWRMIVKTTIDMTGVIMMILRAVDVQSYIRSSQLERSDGPLILLVSFKTPHRSEVPLPFAETALQLNPGFPRPARTVGVGGPREQTCISISSEDRVFA